jgi:HEPN domain-containing protein
LISELPDPDAHERLQPLLETGALLDRYYIPTRYPNGLPGLTPGQAYFRQDAEISIASSCRLLSVVGELMDNADRHK